MYDKIIQEVVESLKGDHEIHDTHIYNMILSMYYVIGMNSMRHPNGSMYISKFKLLDHCHTLAGSFTCKTLTTTDITDILETITTPFNSKYVNVPQHIYEPDSIINMIARTKLVLRKLNEPDLHVDNQLFKLIVDETTQFYNEAMKI